MVGDKRTRRVSQNALRLRKIEETLALVAETKGRLERLPDQQREALVRMLESGGSYDEVARDLGMSTSALEDVLLGARENLRQMIVRRSAN